MCRRGVPWGSGVPGNPTSLVHSSAPSCRSRAFALRPVASVASPPSSLEVSTQGSQPRWQIPHLARTRWFGQPASPARAFLGVSSACANRSCRILLQPFPQACTLTHSGAACFLNINMKIVSMTAITICSSTSHYHKCYFSSVADVAKPREDYSQDLTLSRTQ